MDDEVDRARRAVREALGARVLGLYLHGSATAGGLKPASDLDLLAVTDRSLDDGERRALVDRLLALPGRPVELAVVVQGDVRPWRYPPTCDLLHGAWLREEIAAHGPPRPAPLPNLAVELAQLLAHGRVLEGPDPGELLDPVPPADVVRGCLDGVPDLLAELREDTRNVLLTLARVRVTVATGQVVPKDVAAAWALERLPEEHRPVLRHARELYLTTTYGDEPAWTDDRLASAEACARALLAQIDLT